MFVCFVGGIRCDVVWAVCLFLLFGLSLCDLCVLVKCGCVMPLCFIVCCCVVCVLVCLFCVGLCGMCNACLCFV